MKKKILLGCLTAAVVAAACILFVFFNTPSAGNDALPGGKGEHQEVNGGNVTDPPEALPPDEPSNGLPDQPSEELPDETEPNEPEPDETEPSEPEPSEPEPPTPDEPDDEPLEESGDGTEPDAPHTHCAEHVDGIGATCTEAGRKEYWLCTDCGKYFADEDCSVELAEDGLTIPPTGHSPVTDEAVEATCGHTGLTEGSHCAVCGEVFVAQQVTERLSHDFADGYCTFCGEWQVSDGLIFEATDGGYAVTGFGSCASANVRIPETFAGLPVVKIENDAFSFCEEITAVYIPASVKEIGDYAFYYCTSLTKVYTEEGVTVIGESAFDGCENLTEVRLSETLEVISGNAFSSCSALEEIVIPESVKSVGALAFSYCTSLKRVTVSSGTEIDKFAFMGCSEGLEIYRDGIQQ